MNRILGVGLEGPALPRSDCALTDSDFLRLFAARSDARSLDRVYGEYLQSLFAAPFWQSGSVRGYRVLWTDGRRAREEDSATFSDTGLYLWGCENRPLYIGKTNNSFRKRFARYIWDTRSQCNLAKDFESDLRSGGIGGFPTEIHAWYATYTASTVRLRGAARFAQEGLSGIWFALLRHGIPDDVPALEKVLVPTGGRWNAQAGINGLLNVDFLPKARSRRAVE